MRRVRLVGGWALILGLAIPALAGADERGKTTGGSTSRPSDSPSDEPQRLAMSTAVVCQTIDGYEDYVPLPSAALTSSEKLLIYYRPLNFRLDQQGKFYKAHLTQDGRLRRKGQKAVLSSKDKMLEYEPKNEHPFSRLYLRSLVSLKGLKPGEYEFEIILHDQVAKGPPVTQTVTFRVVPPTQREPSDEASPREEPSEDQPSRSTRPR